MNSDKERSEIFNQSFVEFNYGITEATIAEYDFSKHNHVIDIGGDIEEF